MKNSENLIKTQGMHRALQVLFCALGHRHHKVTFWNSHADPSSLKQVVTLDPFMLPTLWPNSKGHIQTQKWVHIKQEESFAVSILFLARKPFPEKLCHQIAFCISTSCSRVKCVTTWGTHSESSVTFHLVRLSTLSTVPLQQVLPRKNGNRSTQPDSWT